MNSARVSLATTVAVSLIVSALTTVAIMRWSAPARLKPEGASESQDAREASAGSDETDDRRSSAIHPDVSQAGRPERSEAGEPTLVLSIPRTRADRRLECPLDIEARAFDPDCVLYVMGSEVGPASGEDAWTVTLPGPGQWTIAVEVYSGSGQLVASRRVPVAASVPLYELDRVDEISGKQRRSPVSVTLRDLRMLTHILGDASVDYIVHFARDPKARVGVKRAALNLIDDAGHVAAAEALIPLITEAPEIRRDVELTLYRICGGELPRAIQLHPPSRFGSPATQSRREWEDWLSRHRDELVGLRGRFVSRAE